MIILSYHRDFNILLTKCKNKVIYFAEAYFEDFARVSVKVKRVNLPGSLFTSIVSP